MAHGVVHPVSVEMEWLAVAARLFALFSMGILVHRQ
jgi:hypothetical protein